MLSKPRDRPHRSDLLLFLAAAAELLPVNTGLNVSWNTSPCGAGGNRSKLCLVVVDYKVQVYRRAKGGYEQGHGSRAVRIHHIRALPCDPAEVAVCGQRRRSVGITLPVEGLSTDLTKRTGGRRRQRVERSRARESKAATEAGVRAFSML